LLTAHCPLQIIRNDSQPAHEIVAEKELSAYSRFTRNKFVHL
jgi:synaptobrevin family protein YKT6